MRYLNTVYVRNHRARVRCRHGSLLIASPEGSQRIPLEAVDAVVVMGGAQLTTQALDACVRRGVRVAALNRGGAIRFTVNGATGGNVHLRTALFQTAMDERRSLALAKAIVAAKLQNSGSVVGRWSRDETDPEASNELARRSEDIRSRIARLADATTGDGVRGIEGDAARIYFRAVAQVVASAPLQFSARTRRPPRDPINAMLGFCYGLLVTEFIGALESVGLDHQIGFLHRPRSGRPSLALDLAEELRALTDRFRCHSRTPTPGGSGRLRTDTRRRRLPDRRWQVDPHLRMGRTQGHRDPASAPRQAGRPLGAPFGSGHTAGAPPARGSS